MTGRTPARIAAALAVAVLALIATAFAAIGGAGVAAAADLVSVRAVDASEFPQVTASVLFAGDRPDLGQVAVRENGRIVADVDVVPIAESDQPVGVVLVIDTSGSMEAGGKLERAKEAAKRFVDAKAPGDQIAIVDFANAARVAVNFTTDTAVLSASIDALQPAGETALWDGVRLAGSLVGERPDLLPYLLVLSDGADTVSTASADEALAAAQSSGAGVFAIAIAGGGESDVDALRRLADATGGTLASTTDPRELDALYEGVQRVLENQYEISWSSTSVPTDGVLRVSVKLGDAVGEATVPVNGSGVGSAVQPRTVEVPVAPGPLDSSGGAWVVFAVVAVAAGVFALTVVLYLARDPAPLDIINAYSRDGAGAPLAVADGSRDLVPEAVRRIVEATARAAGGGGALEGLENRLDAANVKMTAQEFIVFYVVGAGLLMGAVGIAGGLLLAIAAGIVVLLTPLAVLNLLAERRRSAFTSQLPDALQLLSSSLRAGYSLVQGLEAVSTEVDDPMGRELRRAVLETRLGRELETALDDTARRMNSPDFDWVVIAVRIQREVGGNLAELLTSVAETMVARERLRREVSSLTAEGRLSAIIVGALPFVLAAVLMVTNPTYLGPLIASTTGKVMILGAVSLTCAGFVWMRKVITIDV